LTDRPWQGDACSLVDAFRSGERTPVDELDATLSAIERSDLKRLLAAANPDVAFPAEGPLPTQVGDRHAELG
jgi:hypothetical protein